MNNEPWKRGREWEIQCGPGERLSYSQNKSNKDLSKSNIGFLSASAWIPASKQTARPPSRRTGLTVVCWDFTFGPQTNVHLLTLLPVSVSYQCLGHSRASAAHLQDWITGTLPTSRWVRGQGEVVLVSDPRFHHVYFLKVESGRPLFPEEIVKA